jgi:hypothetical protein
MDTTNIVGRLCQTLAYSNTGTSETTDYTDRMDLGMVAATTTFESLGVASRPLQWRPRRNNLLFHHEARSSRRALNQEMRK